MVLQVKHTEMISNLPTVNSSVKPFKKQTSVEIDDILNLTPFKTRLWETVMIMNGSPNDKCIPANGFFFFFNSDEWNQMLKTAITSEALWCHIKMNQMASWD